MRAANADSPCCGPVKAVVLDWAGTAVDCGCMGPAAVFVDVFEVFGIRLTNSEARRFMGLAKKDHFRAMCRLAGGVEQWRAACGRDPGESAVQRSSASRTALLSFSNWMGL